MQFPDMIRVRQEFNTNPIHDVPARVRQELQSLGLSGLIVPGSEVAVTVGSRGIANLTAIVAALVRELKEQGAKPFIVPAMGSHGGATDQGQESLLAHAGITLESVGAPIKSSMEVVQVGSTEDGVPVLVDRYAHEARHIVVLNRVKPHTDFKGDIESGLMKIMAIGLGKQKGADHYHNVFLRLGYHRVITSVARVIMERCPIAFGLALVENQEDETELIEAVPTDRLEETEKRLLTRARQMLPVIPFDPIDLLIVDRMGKEISGAGMDTNVIARSTVVHHQVSDTPKITRIFVRDLTARSSGNAIGIGNADFTTTRLVEKMDRQVTYMNALTSSCPEAVRIPPYYDNDRQVLQAAMGAMGEVKPLQARIVHIKDTLQLKDLAISDSLRSEAEKLDHVQIVGSPYPFQFDENGNIADLE